ncbi:putative membrane protein [Agromyces sp. CF514]|uniref:hypothetical protein n=1 Tax=Agromyces sp. CF514 TaxID=1881031 RepID=UPI0008F10DC8|nr:hypothetical protein [Agromyces sp. CF514]SFR71541.1 putative membrane protein [Agromyces sp. CF514]
MPGRFSATAGTERLSRLGVIGVLVAPLLIGGVLTWALTEPTTSLDRVTAAIVNDDVPVTVDGSTVPLGRQFAAGLLAGGATSTPAPTATPSASASPSAAASASPSASASTSPSATPSAPATPATDAATAPVDDDSGNFTWVLTNDDDAAAGLRSGRYAAVITIPASFSAAATSMGGPAAQARQAVIEIATTPASAYLDPALTEVVTQTAVSSLNRQLTAQYLGNVYAGFNEINEQIGNAADGADQVSEGAASLSSGADQLASGASQLATGLQSLDTGASALDAGLGELDAASQSLPGDSAAIAAGAAGVADATAQASSALGDATARLAAVVAEICRIPPGRLCSQAQDALTRAQAADALVGQLASGADQVATGSAELADGLVSLVDGLDQTAAGADEVAAGAAQADAGAASLSAGAQSLATGADQLDTGAAQLADGLASATEQIPTYSASDIATLSSVVSLPVLADHDAATRGVTSAPLFAVIAMWFGAMVLAFARAAVPRSRLLTGASSMDIARRSLGPTVGVGAAQGLVVAAVVLAAVPLGPSEWIWFTAASLVVGAVFAVVNQGLAAVLGGAGRLVALAIGLVALVAGLTSTAPSALTSLADAAPTAPARTVLLATLTADAAGGWPALLPLALFGLLGAGLVLAGVMARRGAPREPAADREDAV